MTERKYLLTTAELIDRLSIVLMKSIFIEHRRDDYLKELELIKDDLDVIVPNFGGSRFIYSILVLMLANRFIWENEADIRRGGHTTESTLKKLLATHSVNGLRSVAKNEIAGILGERTDEKLDCLASGLVEQFRNWVVY